MKQVAAIMPERASILHPILHLVKATVEELVRVIRSCRFKTVSLPTVLLWCCIRSGDEGAVKQSHSFSEKCLEMTEKLNTWSVQWLGGCNAHYDSVYCMCVCYRVSRWVYVISAVQADAELIVSGQLQRSIAFQKHWIISSFIP